MTDEQIATLCNAFVGVTLGLGLTMLVITAARYIFHI